ncbi:TolC family protein [Mucilaginibacter sp.]|uniref:TolC family protein n=1 Tax=Mucilaginibacter sp. TaxID=1882438 RepID=UPI0028488E8E|nr:TolC family protein [Mucilaginibacter sp.]MDR3696123.1 TolC family protein [Mucilaginibacter sp.]
MNNKLKALLLSLFILTLAGNTYAQASIFQDLSYPYLEKLIATAKKNYPQVKTLAYQTEIAKSSFHQASFTWLDAFSASYIYSPQGQTTTSATNPIIFNGLQLVATVSIGSLFERPYTIHNARVAVKIAEENQAQYDLTIEAQVKRFYFAYIEAQADLRNKVNAVQDATTAVNQIKHTFDKGETTFEVYSQALTNLYNQNSFRVQAELALFTAKTNLEEMLGTKLESVK